MGKEQNIGIVLSGGGVRGVAHLGVLQALNEAGIYPTHLSGSSAGAIVGAMYAYGYQPEEILEIIIQTNYFKFFRPAISFKAILKMDLLEALYAKYLPIDSFASLKRPFTLAATDIHKGKTVYFSKGPLIRALMASSCIPGMFEPILIDNNYYIDGGVLNNLPVEPLEGICETIIGVNCNHLPEQQNITNIKGLIERTVIMSMNYNVYTRKDKCTYFIEPKGLAQYGVLEIKKAREIFKEGYEAGILAIEAYPKLKSINNKSLDSIKE